MQRRPNKPPKEKKGDRKRKEQREKKEQRGPAMNELLPMMRVRHEDIHDGILENSPYDDAQIDATARTVTARFCTTNAAFLQQVVEGLPEGDCRTTLQRRSDIFLRYASDDDASSITFTLCGFMFKQLGLVLDRMEQLPDGESITPFLLTSKYVTELMTDAEAEQVARLLQDDKVMELVMTWNVMLQFMLAHMTIAEHRKEVLFLMPVMEALRQYYDIDAGDDDAQKQHKMQQIMTHVFQQQFSKFGVEQSDCDMLMARVAERMPQMSEKRNTVVFSKLVKLLTSGAPPELVQQQLPEILGKDVSGEFADIMRDWQRNKRKGHNNNNNNK